MAGREGCSEGLLVPGPERNGVLGFSHSTTNSLGPLPLCQLWTFPEPLFDSVFLEWGLLTPSRLKGQHITHYMSQFQVNCMYILPLWYTKGSHFRLLAPSITFAGQRPASLSLLPGDFKAAQFPALLRDNPRKPDCLQGQCFCFAFSPRAVNHVIVTVTSYRTACLSKHIYS